MAKTYRVGPFVRIANAFMTTLLRRGVEAGGNVLLTVPGRKSGEPRTTPVTILTWRGERYLQSPFGEVNWVRNL
ncbi:MAG TPA: nitroreductase/quinone reductase family protein, partial [Thermomicrobiales bacterium]|nr:nitroreductase/quinone reductase family protein [Thermomicrobiales bacterium]